MLAQLVAQAVDGGGDLVTLRAIIEEASELSVQRVLARMGLDDEDAHEDLNELRQLLNAWRDAKRSARRAVVEWIVRGLLALLLICIAYRFGFPEALK